MEQALIPKANALAEVSSCFGPRLKAQLDALKDAIPLAAALVATPSSAPPAADVEALQSHLAILDDSLEVISPSDLLFNHITVICETAGSLACVMSDDTSACLASSVAELAAPLSALRRMSDQSNAALADAAEDFLSTLQSFLSGGSAAASQTHSAKHLADFREMVADATLTNIKSASVALGEPLVSIVAILSAALSELYIFLVASSNLSSRPSDDDRNQMLAPIAKHIGAVSEAVVPISPRDALFNHAKAIEDTMGMLSWVVADSKPTSFVSEAEGAAAFSLDKILLGARRTGDSDKHKPFVNAMKELYRSMTTYIKEHFPTGLVYGLGVNAPASTAKAPVPSPVSEAADDDSDENYVSAFRALIDGPLSAFVSASTTLGGDVERQARVFAEAWNAEAEFLAKAINMPKPDDVQSMLTPIASKMGEVANISNDVDPRGPWAQHCSAVSESVSALGWVAVDGKATAFVGDTAGAGQFFIDKVKMGARKTENPEAHRTWASCLQALHEELKAYVKEHHTQKLTWNPPKAVKVSRKKHDQVDDDEEDTSDYVSAFKALIAGPLVSFKEACKVLGGEVEEQCKAFAGAWEAEAEFLAKAINMAKPDDVQSMLSPIAEKMGEVTAISEKVDPRGPFAQHCSALSESISALGWVAVDEKATAFVGDMAGAGQFFMDKVKMGAKKTDNPDAHRKWASSLEALYSDLKAYVKDHHTQKLVWNPPKAPKNITRSRTVLDEPDERSEDYVTAFEALINGSLAAYAEASKVIGGDVAHQSESFVAAWKAEAAFLAKAVNMPKPDDVQSMLEPIATEMGKVSAISEKLGPRGVLSQHCLAVSESIAALGWVAVDEKATAFVGEMASAGQFYMDKVKMGARKTDNPDAHRKWVTCLEAVYSDLKVYVKEHHTQKLTWNPPKAVKKTSRSRKVMAVDEEGPPSDYVTAFNSLISGPLAVYLEASTAIGGEVAEQSTSFAAAWKAEADFLSKAINMPKPGDIQSMLAPIASKMGEVGVVTEKMDRRAPLAQHCNAVSESIAALGWVAVDEKATAFVGDMVGAGQFFMDKVKMGAKKTDKPDVHRKWAASLETLYSELKAYVKEYHTSKLIWNPPKATKRVPVSQQANEDSSRASDYVAAYRELISGPVATYLSACSSLGGTVEQQSKALAAAFEAEADFLAKAINMKKPDDVQAMLTPIAEKMQEVGEIATSGDPRGPFSNHCTAVSESIAALGWVAVDEKATGFVGDMAGAGQFFVDKVKMMAKKSDNAEAHRAWASAIETVYAELKAYVKEYHTQKLVWNS